MFERVLEWRIIGQNRTDERFLNANSDGSAEIFKLEHIFIILLRNLALCC